jgi:hypothetical protein
VAGPKGVKAVHAHVHVHEHVNDHENDNRSSFSILDKRSISFYMGTTMMKGVVVDVLVHVVVDVNGIFHLITQWDVN